MQQTTLSTSSKKAIATLAFMMLAPTTALAEAVPVSTTTLPEVKVDSNASEDIKFRQTRTTSGSKFEADTRDVAQSISVVTTELNESQGSYTLKDALRNVAGLTIAAGEGGVTGDSMTLRGFAARTDLYLDGVLDNGQYVRDTFFTQNTEVLKGASSMLFGRGSTGGVVNQISKKPKKGEYDLQGDIGLTYGSFDFKRVDLDAAASITSDVQARIAGVMQDAGSFRDFNFTKRQGIAPSLGLKLSDNTKLTLLGLIQHEDSVFDYGVPMYQGKPADVKTSQFYGYADDRLQQYNAKVATAVLDHDFGAGLKVRNTMRYGDYDRLYRTHLFGSVTGTGTAATVARNQSLRLGEQNNLINQTDFQYKSTFGGMANTLAFGAELGRQTNLFLNKDSTGTTSISVFNPVLTDTVGAGRADDFSGTLKSNSYRFANTGAVYAMNELQFAPNWKAVLGMRYDVYKIKQDDRLNNANDLSHTDKVWSPRAGLIWQPNEAQSYYLSYGESFNPSGEGLSLSTSNANLAPELNKNYELGAKLDFLDGKLSMNTALFRIEKVNARTTDPSDPSVQILAGKQSTNGFEIGFTGRITAKWDVSASYALLDAVIDSSTTTATGTVSGQVKSLQGMTAVNVPTHSGALWNTYRMTPEWSVGGGVFFVSSRYTDSVNEVQLPGYARWDAVVAYTKPKWAFQVNMFNLLDTKYYESGQAKSALPGIPLSANATLKFNF
ncbi:MAG: TonB-dependent siderophore receptor [Sulfuriferula sp.]|nr:TonB-dependent siderophore receptor [Sulfuriferula sp.]